MKKSPIKVRCKPLLFGLKRCDWVQTGKIGALEFQDRRRSGFAIVHPSTKTSGMWQASFFDDDGPVRDTQHKTVGEALQEVPPSRWKLKKIG